ncbi:topoisomerase II-associated protein PAT1-domain-containing protein [Irpex lacteus]|nr:topoisomerase II-associated protein PAT1-domain-containing protein [Irpex lacteus]
MSFFGFDQNNDLEEEKRRILERGANGDQEGLAVYTWGEESYDGLGDALQEGGDELNDETFGGSGAVDSDTGKDFDFAAQALPTDDLPGVPAAQQHLQHREQAQPQYQQRQESPQVHQPRAAARPVQSLEAIWDNKSPFSVLPKQNGASPAPVPPPQQRILDQHAQGPSSGFSPFDLELEQQTLPPRQQQPITLSLGANQTHGVRTLEEIEAEMREAFAAQRLQNQSPSQAQLLHQAQLRNVQRHAPQHFLRINAAASNACSRPVPAIPAQHQQQHHQLCYNTATANAATVGRHPAGRGQYRRHGQRVGTPSRLQQQQLQQQQLEVPFQQNLQYLPRRSNAAEAAGGDGSSGVLHSLQGSPVNPAEDKELQEQLRAEAMRKIMEAERMEENVRESWRRSDICPVSQLVTQDPFSDDFYAQVFGRLLHSRLGVNAPEAVLKFGSGGGVGLGLGQVKGGRRQSAMQRMEQQVERIVNNARLREKEKTTLNNLQGLLARPQAVVIKLPLATSSSDSGSGNGTDAPTLLMRTYPRRTLSRALKERLKEDQPPPESEAELLEREERFAATASRLYDALRVSVPLETSQLDVVKNSVILDQIEESPEGRKQRSSSTPSFIMSCMLSFLLLLPLEHDLFNQLFTVLSPHLLFLFPSVRQAVTNNIPLANVPDSDDADQPVWQFLAILAAHAAVEQQQILVSAVKERYWKAWRARIRIRHSQRRAEGEETANVNIFLHALGLDSSQIASREGFA